MNSPRVRPEIPPQTKKRVIVTDMLMGRKEQRESGDGETRLQQKANFSIVTGSLHFPFIHLVWAFIFSLYYSFYSHFVLYLISPEQVFHGMLGSLI